MASSFEDWIGVDFDGTLATYYGWDHPDNGLPIPAMVDRVKAWLAAGKQVRILTARVARIHGARVAQAQAEYIREWCIKHLGHSLMVTAEKDNHMMAIFDDRAVGVEKNTGRLLNELQEWN